MALKEVNEMSKEELDKLMKKIHDSIEKIENEEQEEKELTIKGEKYLEEIDKKIAEIDKQEGLK